MYRGILSTSPCTVNVSSDAHPLLALLDPRVRRRKKGFGESAVEVLVVGEWGFKMLMDEDGRGSEGRRRGCQLAQRRR